MDLHQRIAGVGYVVAFPPAVALRAESARLVEFSWPGLLDGDAIYVEVVLGNIADRGSWQTLVSEGPAWSIRRDGGRRCLVIGQPVHVMATWAEDGSRASVQVLTQSLKHGDKGVAIDYPAGYPVDQILFMYYLASRQGLLVHAAGLVRDGRALLFPGVSGAGKSTLSRQFLAVGDPGLLSDDRIIVRWFDGAWQAFGTPWPGDAGIAVNAGAPLRAILFPAKASETSIRALSPQEALDRLLPATSILWHEPELLTDQLATTERLLREIPAFELAWSLEKGVVDDVREFVSRL